MMELKRCPFCGGEELMRITNKCGCCVECCNCGAKVGSFKKDGEYLTLAISRKMQEKKAEDKWNRRYGDNV